MVQRLRELSPDRCDVRAPQHVRSIRDPFPRHVHRGDGPTQLSRTKGRGDRCQRPRPSRQRRRTHARSPRRTCASPRSPLSVPPQCEKLQVRVVALHERVQDRPAGGVRG